MTRKRIKYIIFVTSLSLLGLLVTQLIWTRKAYQMARQHFDHRANLALNDVIDDLQRRQQSEAMGCSGGIIPRLKPESRTILQAIDTSDLSRLLSKYIDYHRLDPEYYYAIVHTDDDSIIYKSSEYFNPEQLEEAHKVCLSCLWDRDTYHLAVIFPMKFRFIFLELAVWFVFSGLFLIIVIFSFAYIVLTIIRQKKLSEIKNDFVNNMTHEFKTPISTISLASEVLLNADEKSSSERIKKYIRIIFDENQRMRLQVERVLQMAVMEKGEIHLKKNPADLHQLVRDAIHHLCLEQCDKPPQIQFQLDANPSQAMVDMLHMVNIITNLLDNAIKYSKSEPEVKITSWNNEIGIFLEFVDNGIGMTYDTQKHIFDKFYRVPTGNIHNVKGFGLGLYYVKTMVEAHGGSVSVKSELNKGSRFLVYIPYQ